MATFIGTDGADNITGTTAAGAGAPGDTILGNGGNDTLTGNTGDDVINGGTGNDSMAGDGGNDTYYVDSAGDVVREAVVAGSNDSIISSVNYTLSAGSQIENLYYGVQDNTTQAVAAPGVATVTGTAGIAFTGNEFSTNIFGTTGNDFLAGGRNTDAAAGDVLNGGAGDDTYLVSNVNTTLTDASGNDTVFVSITDLEASGQAVATYTLGAGVAIETLSAQSQRDTQNFSLTGNATDQKVIGNFGANTLNGGGGADTLIGLDGNDTYQIVQGTETIQETTGFDTLTFAANLGTYNLTTSAAGANAAVSIERIVLSTGTNNVTGNTQGQTLDASGVATATAATLNGGAGNDTLIGHAGADTFVVDQDGETVTETTGATGFGGTDTVIFNGTTGGFNLADGQSIEVIAAGDSTTGARLAYNGSQTTGTAAGVYLVGNDVSQAIFGAGGADILNGDRGTTTNADTLAGGAGNDTYRVYNQTDVVIESQFSNAGVFTATDAGGTDTIFTSATYSLATNAALTIGAGVTNTASVIETLSAADQSATTAINLTGFTNAERLIGNAGANTLDGGLNSTVIAANGSRVGDTLQGLAGNDAYVVHSVNDVVIEAAGGGTDSLTFATDYQGTTVGAGAAGNAYVLAAGSEIDLITLSAPVTNFTGNEFAQTIIGSAAAETITGGGGADLLQGGDGNDVYNIADNLAVVQDTSAADGAGVANTVNYTGTTGGYNIGNASTITAINATGTFAAGSAGVFLVGNNLVQTITGGAGADILNGNGGTTTAGLGDRLVGGDGNDTYRVYTSNLVGGAASTAVGDQVVETSTTGGNDTVYTSASYILTGNVENLIAADQANVTTLTLIGNELNNVISGSNGNNVLVGGAGNDTLTGLGGADTFHFNQAASVANADTIADFNVSQGDRISLDAGQFTGFGGSVDGMEFQNGTVATGNQATILYDQSTGRLFYDADGAGAGSAALLFATVSAGTALSASNFVITPANTLPTP